MEIFIEPYTSNAPLIILFICLAFAVAGVVISILVEDAIVFLLGLLLAALVGLFGMASISAAEDKYTTENRIAALEELGWTDLGWSEKDEDVLMTLNPEGEYTEVVITKVDDEGNYLVRVVEAP